MQIRCLQRTLGSVTDPREIILKLKIHCIKSMTHLESRELSIMKDDKLASGQRWKTVPTRTSQIRLPSEDRAHRKKSGWTNISFNKQNGTSFQEPRSVHLGDPQKLKIVEKSPVVTEPTANLALCVSSLNSARVLDPMESTSALLNRC